VNECHVMFLLDEYSPPDEGFAHYAAASTGRPLGNSYRTHRPLG
jgi:hypothetical protein